MRSPSPFRALFFGTPPVAVPSLHALTEVAEVVGVVCQPDRPAGRGLAPAVPAVKAAALSLNLPVVQPTKLRTGEFAAWVREQQVDVAVVLAYGRILPPDVLDAPRRGCVNLHASLLPAYRGAAPIAWAILRGETETGVSLMQMDEGLDTGPVYRVLRLPIGADETMGQLTERIGQLAATLVRASVGDVVTGRLHAAPQDATRATHAPPLTKEQGRIDWNQNASQIHNHVRGLQPWPGAFTQANGKTLKILETRMVSPPPAVSDRAPGTVWVEGKHRVLVATARGALEILRAQREGGRALEAAALVNGRILAEGLRLQEAAKG